MTAASPTASSSMEADLVAGHGSPSYSEFDEYTAAINRILKEIDRLARNELRSSEVHIRDFVSKLVSECSQQTSADVMKPYAE